MMVMTRLPANIILQFSFEILKPKYQNNFKPKSLHLQFSFEILRINALETQRVCELLPSILL